MVYDLENARRVKRALDDRNPDRRRHTGICDCEVLWLAVLDRQFGTWKSGNGERQLSRRARSRAQNRNMADGGVTASACARVAVGLNV
jgi:hypothetical protein